MKIQRCLNIFSTFSTFFFFLLTEEDAGSLDLFSPWM